MSRISTGFFVAACFAVGHVAAAAPISQPKSFHLVSVAFSDHGASFYYRILDIQPDGQSGAIVTYSRIGPMDPSCHRPKIESIRATVKGRTPAELTGQDNPCNVNPVRLREAVNRYRWQESVFETFSLGIVAGCSGGQQVILALPMTQTFDYERFQRAEPKLARLWHVLATMSDRVFGSDDLFDSSDPGKDAARQATGAELRSVLTSGRYDTALQAAMRGNVGRADTATFASILAHYRGPINQEDMKALRQGRLVSPESYQFAFYEPPIYSPLARAARIQGRVDLRLTVSNQTGKVETAEVVKGHPLLTSRIKETAEKWRFKPGSAPSGSVELALDFIMDCGT